MIADLKPYPARKDSGVEWLGAVPEHWEVRRLGQIGRLSKGNGGTKEDEVSLGVPCVRYGDLYTTHTYFILKSRSFVSMAKAEDYTPITFGDVLFAASGETIDEIGKSAVNLMQSEACCGGDVILFRSERQVEARYMGYATDCRPAAAQKATMGRGITVKHVYGDQLKYLTLALPPLPEQAAIVRYLDHVDRRIRRYIHAKQKLITLLEEQKQALIHRAVTRGLDPNVRLKSSGVPWLGDVPEHWDVRRLGQIGRLSKGNGGTKEDEVSLGVPCVRYGDLYTTHTYFILKSRSFVSMAKAEDYTPITFGDVLFAASGETIDEIGKSAVNLMQSEACCGGDVILFRSERQVEARYMGYATDCRPAAAQKATMGRGITVKHVYGDQLKYLTLALPPLPEQAAIVRYLDEAAADIDDTVNRTRRQIELLSEYRTRLIADVVTGKLDVRSVAARLPDEIKEPEPLDQADPLIDGEEEPIEAATTREAAV